MQGIFKYIAERWSNWVGDRDMENAIRRHLSRNGYFGRTAKLRNVRLVAVQRPGWLQVFRFEATARVSVDEVDEDENFGEELSGVQCDGEPRNEKNDSSSVLADADTINVEPEYCEVFGLVREDARKHEAVVFVSRFEHERTAKFALWSEGLICLRGAQGLR